MEKNLIRKATLQDLQRITEISNAEQNWVGLADKSFFEKYLDTIPFFLAIESQDKLAGFLMGMDEKTDYDSKNFIWFKVKVGKFYYVDRVVVAPEMKRKGLASQLYNHLITSTKDVPITAEVKVYPEENTESIPFHEKFGFEEIGRFSSDGKKLCKMYCLNKK